MENNKQTAVEWYKERLKHRFLNGDTEESIYEKAKEMEKEQIIEAYEMGESEWTEIEYEDVEDWANVV